MNGYQITFFTQQDRRHHGKPVADWLINLALEMNLRGATLISGSESFGGDRRIHSARFFELADQPQEILMTQEALESTVTADMVSADGLGISYGALGTVNGTAKFISSAAVGVLWTAVSPVFGFGLAAVLMAAGTVALARTQMR